MIKTWLFLHGIQRHQHTRVTWNKRRFLICMQHLFLNYLPLLPPTLLCADNECLPFSDAVFLSSIWNCSLWVLYRVVCPFIRSVSAVCPRQRVQTAPLPPFPTKHITPPLRFYLLTEISLKPSTGIRKWISSLRLWCCAAEKLPRSPTADALAG